MHGIFNQIFKQIGLSPVWRLGQNYAIWPWVLGLWTTYRASLICHHHYSNEVLTVLTTWQALLGLRWRNSDLKRKVVRWEKHIDNSTPIISVWQQKILFLRLDEIDYKGDPVPHELHSLWTRGPAPVLLQVRTRSDDRALLGSDDRLPLTLHLTLEMMTDLPKREL